MQQPSELPPPVRLASQVPPARTPSRTNDGSFGTAAPPLRPAPPRHRTGPLPLPDFAMPFPVTLSPHLPAARRHALAWGRNMGLLEAQPGAPGSYIWDDHKLVVYDFPLCAAGLHPSAGPAVLDLAAQWLTWVAYADDFGPAVYGRELAGARAATDRLPALMPLDGSTPPPPEDALERALTDLWQRSTGLLTPAGRADFRDAVERMAASRLWELADRAQRRVPDPVDHVEMRRLSCGTELTMRLCRLGSGRVLPAEVAGSGPVAALENAAADYTTLVGDVFSYQKEVEYEGRLHNGVCVAEAFHRCGRAEALGVVADLMRSRMRRFQHLAAHELPALELAEPAHGALAGHVHDLENWMAGTLNWHRVSRRYDENELRRPPGQVTYPGLAASGDTAPITRITTK
jgi:germacradienol/geosmin synthase